MLLFSLKCSLIITSIYASTWDGMIFGRIRAWIDGKITEFYLKPIYGCVICMASVWGGGLYIYCKGININIIPHILLTAGINTLISGIIYLAYERNTNQ